MSVQALPSLAGLDSLAADLPGQAKNLSAHVLVHIFREASTIVAVCSSEFVLRGLDASTPPAPAEGWRGPEAAKRLGIAVDTLYEKARKGHYPFHTFAIRSGRRVVRWNATRIEAWLRAPEAYRREVPDPGEPRRPLARAPRVGRLAQPSMRGTTP